MFLDQILDDEIKLEVAVDNHPDFMCGILNGYVLNLYAKRCKLSRIQERFVSCDHVNGMLPDVADFLILLRMACRQSSIMYL